MNPALLWLLACSIRGRIVRSLRLLRQPKYLLGGLVGVGWILWWSVGSMWRSGVFQRGIRIDTFGDFEGLQPVALILGSLAFFVFLTITWLIPWGKISLGFKEAELLQLLPAPISRPVLIRYSLMKILVGAVITAFFLALFIGSGGLINRARMWLSLCVLFVTWELVVKAKGFFQLRQSQVAPALAMRRRLLLWSGFLGLWAILALPVYRMGRTFFEAAFEGRPMESLPQVVESAGPLLGYVLFPFSLVVRPLLTPLGLGYLLALLPAIAIAVALEEWVVRSPVLFEEQALDHAQTTSEEEKPGKSWRKLSGGARTRAPFRLAPVGPPELAIVWKNVMSISRWPLRSLALVTLGFLALLATLPWALGLPPWIYEVCGSLGAFAAIGLPLTAGLAWRNDLRSELGYFAAARSWPLLPERLVLAEVVSPALLAFLFSMVGVGVALASLVGAKLYVAKDPGIQSGLGHLTGWFGEPLALTIALALVGLIAPIVAACLISSSVVNLAVLWMPGWVPRGEDRTKGIAAFGQRLIFATVLGLAMLVLGIPSALLVGAAIFLQRLAGFDPSAWAFPLWGVLAAAPPLFASWLLVRIAGEVWDKFDPSSEILEG